MDLMEIRRRILQGGLFTIGGLPVLIDNARYNAGNGKYNQYLTEDDNYFITGWYDSGDSNEKSYTIRRSNIAVYFPLRFFNDPNKASVDYWNTNHWSERTFSSVGRYITCTVYKMYAGSFFLYDNTNQRFIFKGKNSTWTP